MSDSDPRLTSSMSIKPALAPLSSSRHSPYAKPTSKYSAMQKPALGSQRGGGLNERRLTAKDKFKIAVICSSNMNRSMEAHAFLAKKGFNVESFGTGDKVKLLGSAPDKPNVYEFGTTYEFIYQDLLSKDKNMYTQNGLLHMLDRNRRIKAKPQKFQLSPSRFNLIITAEERVYDQAMDHLESTIYKGVWAPKTESLHLVNIDIQDNHEEATIGAFLITELVQMLSSAEDLDNEIDELLLEFESNHDRNLLHSVLWQ